MKEMKRGRIGMRFLKEGENGDFLHLLNADDQVLCGESEEDLNMMGGRFVEV